MDIAISRSVNLDSILDNTGRNDNLLDLACGKVGDLNHWMEAKLNNVVGIDLSKDNLENTKNGACNRILDKIASPDSNALLNNILLIWGD